MTLEELNYIEEVRLRVSGIAHLIEQPDGDDYIARARLMLVSLEENLRQFHANHEDGHSLRDIVRGEVERYLSAFAGGIPLRTIIDHCAEHGYDANIAEEVTDELVRCKRATYRGSVGGNHGVIVKLLPRVLSEEAPSAAPCEGQAPFLPGNREAVERGAKDFLKVVPEGRRLRSLLAHVAGIATDPGESRKIVDDMLSAGIIELTGEGYGEESVVRLVEREETPRPERKPMAENAGASPIPDSAKELCPYRESVVDKSVVEKSVYDHKRKVERLQDKLDYQRRHTDYDLALAQAYAAFPSTYENSKRACAAISAAESSRCRERDLEAEIETLVKKGDKS